MLISADELGTLMAENNMRLSRTARGILDTSTSRRKELAVFETEAVRAICERNEAAGASVCWAAANTGWPDDADALFDELIELAKVCNKEITPAGKVFREWNLPSILGIDCSAVVHETHALCELIVQAMTARPLPMAAVAEHALNAGRLHPFWDGCGRISRLFSSRLLIAGGLTPPLWEDRVSYFERAREGVPAFATYMTQRITSAVRWLELSRPGGDWTGGATRPEP